MILLVINPALPVWVVELPVKVLQLPVGVQLPVQILPPFPVVILDSHWPQFKAIQRLLPRTTMAALPLPK